ncbi:hypothetical protein [Streptomyces sp. NPDC048385]|uniref:hypothetical protein n=1 Tax=unclassified Streptomyces TaxID=2593676 RepID=UPI00341358C6
MSVTHRPPAVGRRRLLAAAVLALVAATVLTGCRDGQGVRDEGPSAARSRPTAGPAADATRPAKAGDRAG